jgi:hypothetical protein
MRRILWLVKLNILWLFKYRCRIPEGLIVSYEPLRHGDMVGYTNRRLHIVHKVNRGKYITVYDFIINDPDPIEGLDEPLQE